MLAKYGDKVHFDTFCDEYVWMQRFMVEWSGDAGLSQDRSRRDGVWTTVPTEAIPEPRRGAAHEQREELDRRYGA